MASEQKGYNETFNLYDRIVFTVIALSFLLMLGDLWLGFYWQDRVMKIDITHVGGKRSILLPVEIKASVPLKVEMGK